MKESVRRYRKEHAATLAASVRRTLEQESAPTPAGEPRGPSSGGGMKAAGLAALLATALVGFVLLRPSPEAPALAAAPVGVFELARGAVELVTASAGRASSLSDLGEGDPIPAGTVIDTGTAPGRAAVRLAGGASVRLDSDSRVEVASASVLRLERGALYIDAAAVGDAVEVRTTLGVVRDIGTQFEVRLMGRAAGPGDGALRVRVREGAVTLERDGSVEEAGAGEELALAGDGTLTRGAVPVYGPEWSRRRRCLRPKAVRCAPSSTGSPGRGGGPWNSPTRRPPSSLRRSSSTAISGA